MLYFLRGPCKVVIKRVHLRSHNRIEFPDASLAGFQLGSRGNEFVSCRIIARKELGGAKETSCVI
jgi:hypothetical protein